MTCIRNHQRNLLSSAATVQEGEEKHPCFSSQAGHRYSRIHLPVAPRCNISCNYCSRKYDCMNESRPGVCSEILTPKAALNKFKYYKKELHHLAVAGIAGPGEALANWTQTRATMELIKKEDPDIILCLSSNGLKLADLAPDLAEIGVSHITVTVNCLDPRVGSQIYEHVNYQGSRYDGIEGAALLILKQLQGIKEAVQLGLTVKVNIVMIAGINDQEIPAITRKMKELGVALTNIVPFIPVQGSAFADLPPTSKKELHDMRQACQVNIKQMFHCRQCRADAVGLLCEDIGAGADGDRWKRAQNC